MKTERAIEPLNNSSAKIGFALRVEIPLTIAISSVMPQRGSVLQPRVAASATLGKEAFLSSTASRLSLLDAFLSEKRRNRVAVKFLSY
ncbi:MAG TPA: hypothetical protein VE977_08695 [Pyrinomonadaceae bacterium]|nr:hypothetical protein [Pyrinomonadaceae bacterium]